jgi:hypothetical protein
MSNPDAGTTDFQVGGLRDLLEKSEAPPAKGGGGGPNRQVLLIGGAVALVAIVLLGVVLLAGGGGDGGSTASDGFRGIVELKKGVAVESRVRKGATVSICDTATGPVAEGVVVTSMSAGKGPLGSETVIVEVDGTAEQANRVNVKPTSSWKVLASPMCPPVNTTTSSTSAPTPETAPPTSPPETAPTPPPS